MKKSKSRLGARIGLVTAASFLPPIYDPYLPVSVSNEPTISPQRRLSAVSGLSGRPAVRLVRSVHHVPVEGPEEARAHRRQLALRRTRIWTTRPLPLSFVQP